MYNSVTISTENILVIICCSIKNFAMAKQLQSQTLPNMWSKKPRSTESSTIQSGDTESDRSETVELSCAEEDPLPRSGTGPVSAANSDKTDSADT